MDATQDRRAWQRRASWALFLALLPMLTFMGHWPEMVSIPGTQLYIRVPLAGHQVEQDHDGGHHDHAKHCHGDAASCTDAPAAAGVAIALMGSIVALPAAHALLLLGLIAGAVPLAALSVSPELRPPRSRGLAGAVLLA